MVRPNSRHGKCNLKKKSCSSPQGHSSPTRDARFKQGDTSLTQNCGKPLSSSHVLERERCFATSVWDAARQRLADTRASDCKGLRSGSDDQHLTAESGWQCQCMPRWARQQQQIAWCTKGHDCITKALLTSALCSFLQAHTANRHWCCLAEFI